MRSMMAGSLLVAAAALGIAGCGGGGAKLTVKSQAGDVTVSMRLPAGWAVEGRVEGGYASYSHRDNVDIRGWTVIYLAEGKDLEAWVDTNYLAEAKKMAAGGEMLGDAAEKFFGAQAGEDTREAFGWKLVSRTPTKISDLDAIELVEESNDKRTIAVFVKQATSVCTVTFSSPAQQWDENEPVFRAALDSLRIR